MLKYILLFVGGGTGATIRYLLSLFLNRLTESSLPIGTFIVNMLGSFIIGFLYGMLETEKISEEAKLFMFVGFLGGFTTFSSFMLENLNLLRDKEIIYAAGYILLSNILGLICVFAGFMFSKLIRGKINNV